MQFLTHEFTKDSVACLKILAFFMERGCSLSIRGLWARESGQIQVHLSG